MSKSNVRGKKDHSATWLIAMAVFVVGAIAFFTYRVASFEEGLPASSGLESSFITYGAASLNGVVVEGAEVNMGIIPLDVTVTPEWTLKNDGTESIALGEPHASVVEGCCPGPLTLTTATLAPGETARLTFPLQMHVGMDGPHRFDVHVPVGVDGDYLTLGVTGDFG